MTLEEKIKIANLLKERMVKMNISQSQVAKMIGNCSAATINMVVNKGFEDKEQVISREMWNRFKSFLGIAEGWVTLESDTNYKKVFNLCNNAQRKSQSKAIIGDPGTGKSHSLKRYSQLNSNVYYVECGDFWTKKVFLNKLRKAMGLALEPSSVHELVEQIVDHLNSSTRPLVIIDEADKLKDPVFSFFNTFYNETLFNCGFIIAGAPYLEKRIRKGVRQDRQSYKEIFSRVGGEFKQIPKATYDSIHAICHANGIKEADRITEIINRSSGDLRVVKNEVDNAKLLQK